jgi:hypothetical protein
MKLSAGRRRRKSRRTSSNRASDKLALREYFTPNAADDQDQLPAGWVRGSRPNRGRSQVLEESAISATLSLHARAASAGATGVFHRATFRFYLR